MAPCASEIDDTFVANANVVVPAYVDVADIVAVVNVVILMLLLQLRALLHMMLLSLML